MALLQQGLTPAPVSRLLEETAAKIRRGLSYREVLAALLLAGVRNVEPRPSVGFKFQTPRGILLVTNALFPLRNSGLQPAVVWTGGLEYNF